MVELKIARRPDSVQLAEISGRAFDNDIHYGAPGPGGPFGYKSVSWQQRAMKWGTYYKILCDQRLIGGLIITRKGAGHYEVGRAFIEPDFQNQGLGEEAFLLLWQEYPFSRRWTLETPEWNARTRHFYKKMGFKEIGVDARKGVLFERRVPKPEKLEWK